MFKSFFRKGENEDSKISNSKGIKLDTSKATRRLIIPDIHGCSKTLQALLEQIKLEKSDYLFFLGDFIDKGIDSKGVLDIVINLVEQGYQIFPIRGNHEEELIFTIEEKLSIVKYHNQDKLETLLQDNSEFQLQKKYEDFLLSLPYFYELEDYFIVHAGFNFEAEDPFQDCESMVWLRNYSVDFNITSGKRVIHGHTITPLEEIKKSIVNREDRICLDAGAVFYDLEEENIGILICFDLDKEIFYEQKNLERERL